MAHGIESYASRLLFQIRSKSDRPALRRRWVHELTDGGQNRGDLLVMFGEPATAD